MLSALMHRDPDFDGVFFAGVLTTGVFCRPICPARKPYEKNVCFFATSKDAESAGFRACKRCKPDRLTIMPLPELVPEAKIRPEISHKRSRDANDPDSIYFELPISANFDFNWVMEFLGLRAISLLEEIDAQGYWRCTRIGGTVTTVVMTLVEDTISTPRLRVRATPNIDTQQLSQAVIRSLDLDAPIKDFLELTSTDSILRDIVARRPGIRLPVYHDPFEGIIRAILGQQVSLAAARTMGERLVANFGENAPPLIGRTLYAFPSPSVLATTKEAELRSLGFTRTKIKAIQTVSREVDNGTLDLEQLHGAPAPLVDKTLLALPGIGPWTAAYVRMRSLGDRDGFPATDLGVIKALTRVLGHKVTKPEVESLGDRWRPWRSYATLHLWASLADTPK